MMSIHVIQLLLKIAQPFMMPSNRDAPLNCNDIVNYFIAIFQGDHSIIRSLLCLLYEIYSVLQVINCLREASITQSGKKEIEDGSQCVLLYFPIVLLVITISLLFSGVSLINSTQKKQCFIKNAKLHLMCFCKSTIVERRHPHVVSILLSATRSAKSL